MFAADRALQGDHACEHRALGFMRAAHLVVVAGCDHDVDVDVAVAGVTKARNPEPVLLLDAVDEREQLRDSPLRDDDVVVEFDWRDGFQGEGELPAYAPDLLPLALVPGAQNFGGAGVAAGALATRRL